MCANIRNRCVACTTFYGRKSALPRSDTIVGPRESKYIDRYTPKSTFVFTMNFSTQNSVRGFSYKTFTNVFLMQTLEFAKVLPSCYLLAPFSLNSSKFRMHVCIKITMQRAFFISFLFVTLQYKLNTNRLQYTKYKESDKVYLVFGYIHNK